MTHETRILERLDSVRHTPSGWSARCPAHEDGNPSLSITQGEDGRILLHCHAGCTFEAICAAAGIEPRDLRPEAHNGTATVIRPASGRPAFLTAEGATQAALQGIKRRRGEDWVTQCVYPYRGGGGAERARVVRFEPPDGSTKEFRPVSPDGGGGWCIGDPRGKWPLYRLPDLAGEGTIFVVEGEKAAEEAARIGLACTTSAHGANSARKTDWSPLAGREVVVLPDNDEPGRRYADDVVRILQGLEPAARIKVVALPDLPEHGDVAEFIADRRAAGKSLDQIREEIEHLVEGTPFVSSVSEAQGTSGTSVSSVGRAPGHSRHEWPVPQQLPDSLPPVQPFDLGLLAPRLRAWVGDIADRFQCPVEYLVVAVMVGLSGILGRKVAIRPKQLDDWTVVANLWGMCLGRPGVMKTPAIREALRPLQELERKSKDQYDEEEFEFKAAQLVAERRRRQFALVKDQAAHDAQMGLEEARECIRAEPAPPIRRRLIVNDSTVEKLGEILRDNPNGVVAYRDELIGFLRSLDKEGQEGARSFFLEAWDGKGSYTFDRIGRGTIDIPHAIVSVIGGIQPGPLREYLVKAIRCGTGDDGLVQRFQLAVWPDTARTWKNVDRPPDAHARVRALEVYERIERITAADVGADVDAEGAIPFIRHTPAAQEVFDGWRQVLEDRIRIDDEHPALESHLCKYRSLVPSIGLIDHLVSAGKGPVGIESVERAVRWVGFLESHARRIYAGAAHSESDAARRIAKKIHEHHLEDGFTLRSIYRHGWAGLTDRETVATAVQVLLDHDWLREETDRSTGGAPATVYRINPRVLETPPEGTDKTDRSALEVVAGSPGESGIGPVRQEMAPDPTDTTDRSPIDKLLSVMSVPDPAICDAAVGPGGGPDAGFLPGRPCRACGCTDRWRLRAGSELVCPVCHPSGRPDEEVTWVMGDDGGAENSAKVQKEVQP